MVEIFNMSPLASAKAKGKVTSSSKYHFNMLEVGQCFIIDCKGSKATRKNAQTRVCIQNKADPSRQFVTAYHPDRDGLEIARIK